MRECRCVPRTECMSALAVRACFSVVKGAVQYYKLIILDGSLALFWSFFLCTMHFYCFSVFAAPKCAKGHQSAVGTCSRALASSSSMVCAHWVLFSFFIFVCIADAVMILLRKFGFEFERSIQQRSIGRTSAFVAIIAKAVMWLGLVCHIMHSLAFSVLWKQLPHACGHWYFSVFSTSSCTWGIWIDYFYKSRSVYR